MAISLKKLSEISAVSGCEDEARNYILSQIQDRCDEIRIDSMGNIIALKKGKSNKYRILLGTNLDEAGFIVSEITDKGYIKFKPVGSIDPRTVISKRVKIGRDCVKGVIGMKAIHLQTKSEREDAVKIKDLYIDIGEKTKEKAEKRVSLGDYITFDTEFGEIGNNIKGKALDRFGCVCLTEAMSETPAYDTYFVFSAQRETQSSMQGRGMRTAAFWVQPDYALIIDTIPSCDSYKSKHPEARLGDGAVIEYMDKTSIADTKFTSSILELAEYHNIRTQTCAGSVTQSITGSVITAAKGCTASCIALACRYSHTPVSFMNKNDINAVSELCAAFVKESDVIINEITKKTDGM